MKYFGKIDQQEYYNIFNKVLADLQSPYRLHEVKSHIANAVDWNRFGIIALTKVQADMLHSGGVHFSPSFEKFKNSLTINDIDSAIEAYQKIGLFSHLTSDQIATAKKNVSEQEIRILNDALRCFPNVIYQFDTELENLENPYEELLNKLSLISKNKFKPTNITDNFSKPRKNKSLLKFSINGHEYANQLKVESDWIDPFFLDVVSLAVEYQKLDGEFYDLYTGGQEASIIFLTINQSTYLRLNKLLIFSDEWHDVEE